MPKEPKKTEEQIAALLREKYEEEQRELQEKLALEEKNYHKRLFMLDRSNKEISGVKKDVKRHYYQEAKKCFSISNTDDDFPKIHEPQDLRRYIKKWFDEEARDDKECNWFVDCDEYTLLTQDVSVKNTTFVLTKANRPDIGLKISKRVRELLKILGKVDLLIRQPDRLTKQLLNELEIVKSEFRKHLEAFLNKFTHGILSNIERDMELIDAIIAKYFYKCNEFRIDVWTFREVPLPPDIKNIKTIRMETVEAVLDIPKDVDLAKSSLRGLLFHYDHMSDYAPSYVLPPFELIGDLRDSAELEYNTKKVFTKQKLDQMKAVRLEWEEEQKRLLELEEAEAKDKKKGKKAKGKPKKQTPEPPIITENTMVDVESDYIMFEDEEYKRMQENMSASSLNLVPGEINLRQYKIHSRVYSFEYIHRPVQEKHIANNYLLRSLELPDMIKFNKYHVAYSPVIIPEDMEDIHVINELQEKDRLNLEKLILIEIKLTDQAKWWEAPTVCRWEPWEQSVFFSELEPENQDYQLRFDEIQEIKRKLFFNPPELERKQLYNLLDLCLNKFPPQYNYHQIMQNIIMPRMPEEFKFECEKNFLQEMARKAENLRLKVEREIQKEREIFEELANKHRQDELLKQGGRISTVEDKHSSIDLNIGDQFGEELEEEEEEIEIDFESIQDMVHTDQTIAETVPRTLFPEPRFVPKVEFQTVEGSTEGSEKCDKLSEFIGTVDQMRRDELPDFRTIAEIDLRFKDKPEFLSGGVEEDDSSLNIPLAAIQHKFDARRSRASMRASISKKKRDTILMAPAPAATTGKGKHKKPKKEDEVQTQVVVKKIIYKKGELIPHKPGKWCNRDIPVSSFDADSRTIKFYTSRLGYFGVAFPKYIHFPFLNWAIRPNPEMEQSVILNLTTQNFKLDIIISQAGYKVEVILPKKFPLLRMTEFVQFWQLKIMMHECNMNIFPEIDASCYIADHCEKHYAMEMHSYRFFGKYCLSHEFNRSQWNHLGHRRAATVECRQVSPVKILVNPLRTIYITPAQCAFVDVTEECTDISIVSLEYKPNPEDQVFSADINGVLENDLSEYTRRIVKSTRLMLKYHVSNLFRRLRVLSFS